MMYHWARNWWKRFQQAKAQARPVHGPRRATFRPVLEPLEDRLAPANIVDWIGDSAGIWSNPLNWSTNVVPTSSDVATFSSAHIGDATVDAAFSVAGINIVSGYTGTVTMSAALRIGRSVLIVSAGTFDLNGNNLSVPSLFPTLSSSGTITNNSSTTDATLTVTNTAQDKFSGSLADGSNSHLLALTVGGTNTLILSGTNTYSG